MDRTDPIAGLLLGLTAGDRIGGPIRMALELASSLRDRGTLDLADAGSRYLRWWRAGGFDTGPIAAQVFERVARGATFAAAAARVDEQHGGLTAGCNPAHRSAPLALCAALEDAELPGKAIAEARLTHSHPLAGDVASSVVVLCRALVRGVAWTAALESAAHGRLDRTRTALAGVARRDLRAGGFAPEVLAAAVHFLGSQDSFAAALDQAIDFAGPANYCPVLVGAIGGARWGRAAIPAESLHHAAAILPAVNSIAGALAKGWGKASSCGT